VQGHALLFLEQARAMQSSNTSGGVKALVSASHVGGEDAQPKKKGAISRMFKKKKKKRAPGV
jgi:hypothetical protein